MAQRPRRRRRRELDPEIVEDFNALVQRTRQTWLNQGNTNELFWEIYERNMRAQFVQTMRSAARDKAASIANFKKKLVCAYKFIFSSMLILCSYYLLFHMKYQDLIYPIMKFVRDLLIPVLSIYPTLTGFYHGTCLLDNPFYTLQMDCWPCTSVKNINEIQNLTPGEEPIAPFIYKTEQEVITFDKLKDFYINNKQHFDDEAPLILIDHKSYIIPSFMISLHDFQEQHTYFWEFNNMHVAKLLRQIISRPKIVPKFGQSIERFIIVDSSQKEFYIPNTECHNSFLISLSGIRTVELEPAKECQKECAPVSVKLYPTYLLWYNWWYWRPVVLRSSGNTTFIAHSGSYC